MGLLIDTSLIIAFERGDVSPDIVTEDSATSVVTVSGLLHGVHRASAAEQRGRLAAAEHYIALYETIDVTIRVARIHAAVGAALARARTNVGAHDLWVGATALAHGLGVMTRKPRDFARIPQLRVVAA